MDTGTQFAGKKGPGAAGSPATLSLLCSHRKETSSPSPVFELLGALPGSGQLD